MALAARLPGRPPGPVARRVSLGTSLAAGVAALLLLGCPAQSEQPTGGAGPAPDTACPKDFPTTCKVLKDSTDVKTNSTEYHVLLAADTKHSDAEKLLKSLYRHLMTRRDTEPAALAGYLYTSEAQFSTPPLSPRQKIRQLCRSAGRLTPTTRDRPFTAPRSPTSTTTSLASACSASAAHR